MKRFNIFATMALAMVLGLGAAIGIGSGTEEIRNAEAAASTTKETDATGIYYNDKQNWCFRSLHMYNVTYADGYSNTDFESYLTGFYGSKISSWTIQGTTRGWGLNNGTAQDYMICDGGSQQDHAFVFPWWISSFTFQIVNNDNWLCNWGVHSGWGLHTKFDLTVDGKTVTNNSMNPFVYAFPAVTITKKAVDSNTKAIISGASIPSETTSIYDKYPNGGSTPDEPGITVDGYLFDGWYKNQTLTTAFSKKYFTSNATIYAKYNECPTVEVYLNAFDWSNLYIYTFETISGTKTEYYGSFPGKKLTILDSNLKFNNGMVQKVAVPYTVLANAKFVYSNGTDSNKSDDLNVTSGAYYWHNGSAWTKDTSNYAAAASFVYDLNAARLAVQTGGGVKEYSICGLNAKTWVDRYDGLTSAARALVDASTIYTYKDASSTGADTTVTFASVMNELRKRYSGTTSNRFFMLFGAGDNNSSTYIVVIITSILAISAFAGYFFYKKKKEDR